MYIGEARVMERMENRFDKLRRLEPIEATCWGALLITHLPSHSLFPFFLIPNPSFILPLPSSFFQFFLANKKVSLFRFLACVWKRTRRLPEQKCWIIREIAIAHPDRQGKSHRSPLPLSGAVTSSDFAPRELIIVIAKKNDLCRSTFSLSILNPRLMRLLIDCGINRFAQMVQQEIYSPSIHFHEAFN